MPSIGELVIILVLTVAIGVATRFFGRSGAGLWGPRRGGESATPDRSPKRDKVRKLSMDTETGVYVPESDDSGDDRR